MNDETPDKGLVIAVYISLIITAGFFTGAMLVDTFTDEPPSAGIPFNVLGLLAFAVSIILSLNGLDAGSRLLRRHLLRWYGCLFALILTVIFFADTSEKLADNIANLGIVVLLVWPVIWLWNFLRS